MASTSFGKIFLELVKPLTHGRGNCQGLFGHSSRPRYEFIMCCDLIKYSIALLIPNKEVEMVAKAFVKYFVLTYGVPRQVLTDDGTKFMAQVFQDTCKLLKVLQQHSTAYRHKTVRQVEASKRHLGDFLRSFVNRDQNDWDELL